MSGKGRGRPPKNKTETPGGTFEPKSPGLVRKRGSRKKEEEQKEQNSESQVPGTGSKAASAPESRSARKPSGKLPPGRDVTTPAKQETCKPAKCVEVRKVPKSMTRRGSSIEDNPSRILQVTLDKLKIKKKERSDSTRCVNAIQEQVTEHLKRSLDWCKDIQVLKTGSHYENVKICEPDEFDVMLTVSVERVDIHPYRDDGAFYSVALKRHPKHPLDRFLNEDKTIRASDMLKEFREKVKEIVPKLPYNVNTERKKKGCPAVTLLVKENEKQISLDFVLGLEVHSQSWPEFTKNGFYIDNWLGKKVKQNLKSKPFYLVAKYEGKGNTEHNGISAKDAWRISFSHVEKEILKNHGNSKTCCESGTGCCRKSCLKLLKYLLQRLKEKHPEEISKFCSYHAKTTLLHGCTARVEDSKWAASQLHDCFQQLLEDFEVHLRKRHLCNFFIPSHNLLSTADKKSCDFLADCIEYQRNNGFPIFQ